MEQKDIDIYEILKGMPDGTPLYTPMCGNVKWGAIWHAHFTRQCAEMLSSLQLQQTRRKWKQSGLRIRTESTPSTRTANG